MSVYAIYGQPAGPQGSQGAIGPQGFQGPQGATGSSGSNGTQGFQGPQGVIGLQGWQGPQGAIGNTGSTGSTGAQGFQGPQGAIGPQGWQGNQGNQGNQGAVGDTGSTGSAGAQGLQGPQGAIGPQGWQGLQGWQGNQGWQGWQGPEGSGGASSWVHDTDHWEPVVGTDPGNINTGDYILYQSEETNGATQIAHVFDNTNSFSTAGAKLISVKNATTEKANIDKDGIISSQSDSANATIKIGTSTFGNPSIGTIQTGYDSAVKIVLTRGGGAGTEYINLTTEGARLQVGRAGSGIRDGGSGTGGNWSLQFGALLSIDGTSTYASGDTYFVKSAETGGNFSYFYDAAEILRDDGTNIRWLKARRPGTYAAIADSAPHARFGGNHKTKFADVASTNSTSAQDLDTYTIPAATLNVDGDRIDFEMVYTFAANATTKQIVIDFEGTTIFDTGALALNGGSATIYGTIIRTGATTQRCSVMFAGNTTLLAVTNQYTAASETLANALTLKTILTLGVGAAANDCIQKSLVVDVLPVGA